MTEQKDGGPAFPWREEDGEGGYNQHVGMSLRDGFAGKAVASAYQSEMKMWQVDEVTDWPEFRKAVAMESYKVADAMIAARKAKL